MGDKKELLHGFLEDILEDLRRGFEVSSLEEMILNLAANVAPAEPAPTMIKSNWVWVNSCMETCF